MFKAFEEREKLIDSPEMQSALERFRKATVFKNNYNKKSERIELLEYFFNKPKKFIREMDKLRCEEDKMLLKKMLTEKEEKRKRYIGVIWREMWFFMDVLEMLKVPYDYKPKSKPERFRDDLKNELPFPEKYEYIKYYEIIKEIITSTSRNIHFLALVKKWYPESVKK